MKSVCFKKIKKDYQAKSLKNPFFRRKKGGKRRWWRCLFGVIIIFLFALLWFFLASPIWRLKEINISGLTRVAPEALEEIIWEQTQNRHLLFFRENNLFLFKRSVAEKRLADFNFASLEIKKKWPWRLEIIVGEKPYAFIFQEGSSLFYASADGYLIKEAPISETERQKYFLLENKNSQSLIGPDDRILIKDDYRSFIIELAAAIGSSPELVLDRLIIDQEFNTLKVKFIDGPLVYFNTQSSAADQLSRLLLVKKEKIKDNFNKVNYIDLRYGGRIFIN